MLKIAIIEKVNEIIDKIELGEDKLVEIQEPLKFLATLATTTTIYSGVRTESSDIKVPVELENKRFKITDIYITAESSTGDARVAGDNLLVGLLLNRKSLLYGASQSINGKTITLDMLPAATLFYCNTSKFSSRFAHYKLLSELFNNIKTLRIIYSNKSTNDVEYLIYLTIGGVIL